MPRELRLPVLLLSTFAALVAVVAQPAPAMAQDDDEPMAVSAQIVAPQNDKPGMLVVALKIERPWHTYSITQPKGGPFTTRIKLAEHKTAKVGSFTSTTKHEVHFDEDFKMNVEVHRDQVVWVAPLSLPEGTDWGSLEISGAVIAQACKVGACLPPADYAFVAKLTPAN